MTHFPTFYRETPPLDPELAMMSADYWFDHAEQDLAAREQRDADELWNKLEREHDRISH